VSSGKRVEGAKPQRFAQIGSRLVDWKFVLNLESIKFSIGDRKVVRSITLTLEEYVTKDLVPFIEGHEISPAVPSSLVSC